MQRVKQILSGLAVAIACSPLMVLAATEITLRERVATNGSVVRLADVAEIKCDDEQEALRLASLPLMPAPGVGGQRFLRKREVEDLLAAHRADLGEVRIQGAAQVVISAAEAFDVADVPMNRHAAILAGKTGQPVAMLDPKQVESLRQDVQRLVEAYLSTKPSVDAGREVACDVAERHLAMLQTAKSAPVCSGGSAPWTGRQRLVISFATAHGQAQFPVYAEVATHAVPVVVAVESIPRGAVITAAHVELRTIDRIQKANDRRMPVDSVEQLIGMEARQTIAAGAVVYSDQVQPPVLVKRNELITVSSQAGGIRVRTTVRALQDRSQGELVQVESLETKERFDARVTGLRTAAIVTLNTPSLATPSTAVETARR
jgi:flagella basal body P-ring formation protein FlgA